MEATKKSAPIRKNLISAKLASEVQSKAVFKFTEFLAVSRVPNLDILLFSVVEGCKIWGLREV